MYLLVTASPALKGNNIAAAKNNIASNSSAS